MNDEYQKNGNEYTNNIPEFKELKAVEYYTPKEIIQSPKEILKFLESSVDNSKIKKIEIKTPEERLEERKKRFDRANKARNNADGTKTPDTTSVSDVSATPTGAETTASTTGEAASTSASASSTSASAEAASAASSASATAASASTVSVASLAGSVTVVAAAAVAMVTIVPAITEKAPKIVYDSYITGTDYIQYEIELDELTEGVNYKIKVTGINDFRFVQDIDGPGTYSKIIGGLVDGRRYSFSVVAETGDVDIPYYSKNIYTDRNPMPEVAFDFIPDFDYETGTFDVTYEAYVSDFYKTSKDFYLQIFIGDEKKEEPDIEDHMLPEDNFFRGTINALTDLSLIEANVYCTYYDDVDTLIGQFGYRPNYPDDFNAQQKYESKYDIKEPTVTYSNSGYSLSIDTGFVPSSSDESYIIDIYKTEENTDTNLNALEKVLLASYEGTDKVFNAEIPGDVNGIDVYFTGVKTVNDKKVLFDTKKIYSYSLEEAKKNAPEPTATIEFIEDYDPIDDIYNVDYKVDITDVFNTGTNYKVVELIDNEIVNEAVINTKEYESSFNTLANGVNIAVIVYCNYNDNKEQIIVGSDEKKIEYPEPFKDIEYFFTETSYGFSFKYSKENSNKTFNLNIIQNNKDKTTNEYNYEFVDICEYTNNLDGINLSDIESFDLKITCNDNIIKKLVVYPDESTIEFGAIDADEDGNIVVPYEINIPDGGEFVSASITFDGILESFEVTKLTGSLNINSFNSNILKPKTNIKYNLDTEIINKEIVSMDINIGAEYEISYYATHFNSYYQYANIKFDAKLAGKNVNINLDPSVGEMTDNGINYVKITDRDLGGLTTGLYRDYYIVQLISNGDDYGLYYKIDNEGFDNESHNVIINQYFNNEDSYSVGYEKDDDYFIDYCKTLNEDGTVNYYFDTKMEGFTNNHYGKIAYSYLDGGVLKYGYTDYFNTRTYELLNLENKEYDFSYSVFYKENDVYYDLNINNTDIKEYKVNEIKVKAMDMDMATISKLKLSDSDDEQMVIDFVLERENVDETKPITVTYDNTIFNIEIPADTSNPTSSDGNLTNWTSEDKTYGYRLLITNENIKVEAYKNVSAIEGDISYQALVNYTAKASDFLDQFGGSLSGEYDLSGDMEKTIGQYTGIVNIENIDITHENPTLDNKGTITIKGIDYTHTDYRDRLNIVAYSNDKVVISDYYDGEEVILNIDPAYTNINLKLVKAKNQYVEPIGPYDNLEIQEIIYETIDLGNVEFEPIQVISSVELFEEPEFYGLSISYNNNIETFDNYMMEVTPYYETQCELVEDEPIALEYGIRELMVNKRNDAITKKLVINIYNKDEYDNQVLQDSLEIPLSANLSFGSIDVDDDGNVVLPYEIILDENMTLLSDDDYVNDLQFSGLEEIYNINSSGNVIIKELESNILAPIANLNYKIGDVIITQRVLCADINLGAEYEVSYYATHYNSQYSVNIKFDAKIDGKNVNILLNPKISKEIDDFSSDSSSIEYVYVEDALADEKEHFGYYVVRTIETEDSEGTYYNISNLSYMITNEGFDNEIHSIDTIYYDRVYNSSDYKNYQAGYSTDNVIYYVKTKNLDGTVNYYFDTGFTENATNHYGRIEYSYVVDGVTKYFESEFSTGKTMKLLNMEDLDYTFNFAPYYKYNDVYYYMSCRYDGREISSDSYYRCEEKNSLSTLNLNNSTIALGADADNNKYAVIDFTIETNNFDKNSPLVVNYNDEDINIDILDYDANDDSMAMLDDNTYQYSKEIDALTRYVVKVYSSEIKVEVIKSIGENAPKSAKVTYLGGPNEFINSYVEANGENDIINYESLTSNTTANIGEFTGTYDVNNFKATIDNDNYQNSINIELKGYKATDSRDKLMAIVYSNEGEINRTIASSNSIYINLDSSYTNVSVKLVEIKNQSIAQMGNILMDNDGALSEYQIEYNVIDFDEFEFEKINNISLASDGDVLYTRLYLKDAFKTTFFDEYEVKIERYAKELESSSSYEKTVLDSNSGLESYDVNLESGELELSFNTLYHTNKITVLVYNKASSEIYRSFDINLDANINDFEYDEEDSVVLPTELIVPEGAVINDYYSTVQYESLDPIYFDEDGFANVRIDSLDSNEITLHYTVRYDLNGVRVDYSFDKDKTIDITIDYDYEIAGFWSSGNAYITDENHDKIYYANINFNAKSNNVIIPYTNYSINVTNTAGQYIPNSNDGSITPKNNSGPISYNYDAFKNGIKLVFVHSDDNDLGSSLVHCILEFNIVNNGVTGLTNTITFDKDFSTLEIGDVFKDITRDSINNDIVKKGYRVDIPINTGFDSTVVQNYYYKLKLINDGNVVDETDYLTSSSYTFVGEVGIAYNLEMVLYYFDGTNYYNCSNKTIEGINSAIPSGISIASYNSNNHVITSVIKSFLDNDIIKIKIDDGEYNEINLSTFDKDTIDGVSVTVTNNNEFYFIELTGTQTIMNNLEIVVNEKTGEKTYNG